MRTHTGVRTGKSPAPSALAQKLSSRRTRLRLGFLEQYYYPDGWGGSQIPCDITSELSRAGFDVTVFCGSEPYVETTSSSAIDPRDAGVRIVRVPRLIGGHARTRKYVRHLWFCAIVFPMLVLRRRFDLYVTQTNPPLGVIVMALAARLARRPLLIIAQDVYPETLIAHGAAPQALSIRLLGWAFGAAYRSASRVVVLGPVMRRRVAAKRVPDARIVEISNWSTGEEGVVRDGQNVLRDAWGVAGRFVILYSGNLGLGHEFETLLEGFARAAREHPSLLLVIVGNGGRLGEVLEAAVRLGIADSVLFKNFVPAEMLPHSQGLADVSVVTLRPGFEGLMVPSKVLGYIGRGAPVLYVGPPSDVSHLIQQAQCGFSIANGDVEGVAAALRTAVSDRAALAEMGARGRAWYDAHLSRQSSLLRYVELVRTLVEAR